MITALVGVAGAPFSRTIFYDPSDEFAAREARRYILLTTGGLSDLRKSADAPTEWLMRQQSGEAVVITSKWQSIFSDAPQSSDLPPLGESEHALSQTSFGNHTLTLLIGGGSVGRLYSAYTLAESLGVRFSPNGDTLPDPTAPGGLPLAAHARAPLPLARCVPTGLRRMRVHSPQFAVRGLQPFHDFPEGPDWWDAEMYKHVVGQIAKMKMNFIGLHTYPYGPNPVATGHNEPTVWVGLTEQLSEDGKIKESGAYPTSYANTMRGEWGYAPLPTSNYSWGSAQLFESDCYAPPPMDASSCPVPEDAASQIALFERTSTLLQGAFELGDQVGVQSCVGTEVPLATPLRKAPTCHVTAKLGCFADDRAHILPHVVANDAPQNSLEWCAGQCALVGLGIGGVEFGVNCFCGPSLPNASHAANATLCATHQCPGNPKEICGGWGHLIAFTYDCPGFHPHRRRHRRRRPTTRES